MSQSSRIFLSPPDVTERERELLLEAFDSNYIAPVGAHLNAFEEALARHMGAGWHTVALSSATAGLHLALRVLGVGPGDAVIVPTFTFAAPAFATCHAGATPVFAGCDSRTWGVCPEAVAEACELARAEGLRPRAVIAVDLYGQCADYECLLPLCKELKLPLVQDAAEAVGATWQGQPAGAQGALAVYSFNGNKMLTTGGGGALLTQSAEWAERVRRLAHQARAPMPWYEHEEVGFNYRLCNLLAAVGLGQLERLPAMLKARRRHRLAYEERLGRLPGVQFSPRDFNGQSNCWLTCLHLAEDCPVSPTQLQDALAGANIESRHLWKPMHMQPVFQSHLVARPDFAEHLFARGLCLPSGSNLRVEQHEHICCILEKCFNP